MNSPNGSAPYYSDRSCCGLEKRQPANPAVTEFHTDISGTVRTLVQAQHVTVRPEPSSEVLLRNAVGVGLDEVHTNLNGRQARWTINLAWTSGPTITYVGLNLTCRENKNNLPDSICGSSGFKPTIGPGTVSWKNRAINGERLASSNPYNAELSGSFDADGSRFGMRTLRTLQFNCFGNDNCYFPER